MRNHRRVGLVTLVTSVLLIALYLCLISNQATWWWIITIVVSSLVVSVLGMMAWVGWKMLSTPPWVDDLPQPSSRMEVADDDSTVKR